jgi:hypothetical protein
VRRTKCIDERKSNRYGTVRIRGSLARIGEWALLLRRPFAETYAVDVHQRDLYPTRRYGHVEAGISSNKIRVVAPIFIHEVTADEFDA